MSIANASLFSSSIPSLLAIFNKVIGLLSILSELHPSFCLQNSDLFGTQHTVS